MWLSNFSDLDFSVVTCSKSSSAPHRGARGQLSVINEGITRRVGRHRLPMFVLTLENSPLGSAHRAWFLDRCQLPSTNGPTNAGGSTWKNHTFFVVVPEIDSSEKTTVNNISYHRGWSFGKGQRNGAKTILILLFPIDVMDTGNYRWKSWIEEERKVPTSRRYLSCLLSRSLEVTRQNVEF